MQPSPAVWWMLQTRLLSLLNGVILHNPVQTGSVVSTEAEDFSGQCSYSVAGLGEKRTGNGRLSPTKQKWEQTRSQIPTEKCQRALEIQARRALSEPDRRTWITSESDNALAAGRLNRDGGPVRLSAIVQRGRLVGWLLLTLMMGINMISKRRDYHRNSSPPLVAYGYRFGYRNATEEQ